MRHSEVAVNLLSIAIFCLYCGVLPGLLILFHSSRWRRKNFPLTPHQTPSCSCQVLHVRCAPQQNSQWQFWASVCVCMCMCGTSMYSTVANHASPWFNRGGPGAWLRHDLGPGQLPGSLPTCHCQVQHQVGHACQARGGQCWEEDGESNVMDGSEKWTDLKGFFCPDTRQIPAIEQDTVPDYGCIVIPGVFWHTQRATFVRRAPPTVKLICIYIYI